MEPIANKPIKTFRSKQEIEHILRDQLASGLSIKAFCAANGFHKATFHYWKKKATAATSQSKDAGFASVTILPSTGSHLFAEVGNIKLYQPVSAAYLKELLP